jgi:hypothetical protein
MKKVITIILAALVLSAGIAFAVQTPVSKQYIDNGLAMKLSKTAISSLPGVTWWFSGPNPPTTDDQNKIKAVLGSSVVIAWHPTGTPGPTPPTGLAASSYSTDGTGFTLSWNGDAVAATGRTVAGYDLYKNSVAAYTNITGLSKAVTGQSAGTSANWTIAAFDNVSSTLGNQSAAVAVLTIPAAPTGHSLVAGDSSVTMHPGTVTGGVTAHYYLRDGADPTKTTNDANGTCTDGQVISSLTNGHTYHVAYTYSDASGEGNLSTVDTATPASGGAAPVLTAFTMPGTSTTLAVSVSSLTATNSPTAWMISESSTQPSSGDSGWGSLPSSYTFSTSGNVTAYAWAKNATGVSALYTGANVAITAPVPTGQSVTAGLYQNTLYLGTSAGAISFDAYWTSDGTTPTTASNHISGVTNGYVHSGLTSGLVYKYVFTATNAVGTSAASTVVSGTPTALAAPTGHSTVAGDTQITVHPGTAPSATGYKYYLKAGADPTTSSYDSTGTATDGQTVTGLTNGTAYHVGYTATITGHESALSTIDTATPASSGGLTAYDFTGFTMVGSLTTCYLNTGASFTASITKTSSSVMTATNIVGTDGYVDDGTGGDFSSAVNIYAYKDLGVNHVSGDFTLECAVNFSHLGSSQVYIAALSSAIPVLGSSYCGFAWNGSHLSVNNANPTVNSNVFALSPATGTTYYVRLVRAGSVLTAYIGTDPTYATYTESQSATASSAPALRYASAPCSVPNGSGTAENFDTGMSCTISNLQGP